MEFAALLKDTATGPEGFVVRARPGWRYFTVPVYDEQFPDDESRAVVYPQDWEIPPVPLGPNQFPEHFELEIREEAAPYIDDSSHVALVIGFRWTDDGYRAAGVHSSRSDVLDQLDRLRNTTRLDMGAWLRRGLLDLVLSDVRSERAGNDDALSNAAKDRVRSAMSLPTGRRRDRVTTDLLQRAAAVYREAWAAGGNPTQAVAAHFHKSHSTAARWVMTARKIGLLGPAQGSRGGEVGPADE